MSRPLDWLQLAAFVALLALITKPMGLYLCRVLDAKGKTTIDFYTPSLDGPNPLVGSGILEGAGIAVARRPQGDWGNANSPKSMQSFAACASVHPAAIILDEPGSSYSLLLSALDGIDIS